MLAFLSGMGRCFDKINSPSHLQDTTNFINFIEKTKVNKNTLLVSMDVTSLYTNLPHEGGIASVCKAYDKFSQQQPSHSHPIPRIITRDALKGHTVSKNGSISFSRGMP